MKTDNYTLPKFSRYIDALADAAKAVVLAQRIMLGLPVIVIIVLVLLQAYSWIFLVIPVAIASCYLPPVAHRIRNLAMSGPAFKAFAAQNGMRYIDSAKPNYNKHFLPAVAKLGLFERQEEIVKGEFGGHQLEMYAYTYRHMFARRYTRVAIRVYCLQLPKELPHIFMRNRQAGSSQYRSLQRHFDDDQRIDLEGNFDKYFTVYAHRRMGSDALSILAPNVMESLVKSNTKFDIEIIGNKLYMYTGKYVPLGSELEDTFKTMAVLMKHIDHRLKSWKYVLPNNKKYPYLISRPGFGTLAIGGKYYNASWKAILLFNGWWALKLTGSPEYRPIKLAIAGAGDAVIIGALIIFRRKYQLSKRNVAR